MDVGRVNGDLCYTFSPLTEQHLYCGGPVWKLHTFYILPQYILIFALPAFIPFICRSVNFNPCNLFLSPDFPQTRATWNIQCPWKGCNSHILWDEFSIFTPHSVGWIFHIHRARNKATSLVPKRKVVTATYSGVNCLSQIKIGMPKRRVLGWTVHILRATNICIIGVVKYKIQTEENISIKGTDGYEHEWLQGRMT